jgi:tripartite-type tricarboxylate transporter receptor subunit TctC
MKAQNCVRRPMLNAVFLIAGVLPAFNPAAAQEWPARNMMVVVPLGAGSASDVIARVVMDQVAKQLGATIIIENRPGAGGTIGANMVAKSAPDSYTALAYGGLASANALYKKLPYDTLNDLVPVIALGQQPLVVVTPPSRGWKTLGDLIAAAKQKPGALNYSSAGVGSATHFGAERLRASAGFEAQHIPFKGAAEAVAEVIAGRIDFSVQPFATTLSLLRDGQLVGLAVSAGRRASVMPQVPTTIEAGLPANSVYPFYSGLFVPAKMPRDVVDKLHREIATALRAPAVRAQFALLGVEPMAMNQEQFAKFFRDDVAANLELVKIAKIPTQ